MSAPRAILVAPCVGSTLRGSLPVPAHHLWPEAGELGKEGAEQHREHCSGAAILRQCPSQAEDLRGATWKPGSRSSLHDGRQRHHPSGHHGDTVRTTLAFTAEKSPCHFLGAAALYHVHICKEGQNPGQLLKCLKTGTEKEVELPNLSSPPIQVVKKKHGRFMQ